MLGRVNRTFDKISNSYRTQICQRQFLVVRNFCTFVVQIHADKFLIFVTVRRRLELQKYQNQSFLCRMYTFHMLLHMFLPKIKPIWWWDVFQGLHIRKHAEASGTVRSSGAGIVQSYRRLFHGALLVRENRRLSSQRRRVSFLTTDIRPCLSVEYNTPIFLML